MVAVKAGSSATVPQALSAEIEDAKDRPVGIDRLTFCQPPTATGKNSKAFSEHLAREVIIPAAGRWSGLLFTGRNRRNLPARPHQAGHHAYIGGLSEHTVAVGTRSPKPACSIPKLAPTC